MDFLTNAFRSLNSLNEEVFDLSVNGENDELKDFLDNDEEVDTLTIIDDEAENEEELEDSYMGKVILDCNVCHSLIYKNPEDVVIDGDVVNIEEECPYCYSQDGFKVIGQVKPFEQVEDELEDEEKDSDELEDETDESDDEIDEPENDSDDEMEESLKKDSSKPLNELFGLGKKKKQQSSGPQPMSQQQLLSHLRDKFSMMDKDDLKDDRLMTAIKIGNGGIDWKEDLKKAMQSGNVTKIDNWAYKGLDFMSGSRRWDAAAKKDDERAAKKEEERQKSYNSKTWRGGHDPKAPSSGHYNRDGSWKYESLEEGENCDDCDEGELDEFLDVNAQGQTIGLGFGGGTGISNGQAPGGLNVPGMGEDLEEDKDCDDEELDECGDSLEESADGSVKDFLDKMNKCSSKEEVEKIVAAAKGNPNADKAYKQWKSKLEEGLNKVDIETDDQHLAMESDESGRVTVTSEPKDESPEDFSLEDDVMLDAPEGDGEQPSETIGDVSLGTELDIENSQDGSEEGQPSEEEPQEEGSEEESEEGSEEEGSEGEAPEDEEIDIDEFDEESFDDLGESFLKKVYGNVESFKTSKVSEHNDRFIIEGIISFNSGSKKNTKFVFKTDGISKNNKVMFEGFNKEIARANKSFKMTCDLSQDKIVCEKLNYRYKSNKSLVEGFVRRNK